MEDDEENFVKVPMAVLRNVGMELNNMRDQTVLFKDALETTRNNIVSAMKDLAR